MGGVRELHGGRDYDPSFGKRMTGEGVHARLIARRFEAGCRRYGLTTGGRVPRGGLLRRPRGTGERGGGRPGAGRWQREGRARRG